jgi:hypothetical protein
MKYKIGDILCYEDTFEETVVSFTHFVITDVDERTYYVMCLDDEVHPDESYNISWVNSSPKWKKVTE